MSAADNDRTSPTLLGRLRAAPHDQAAWSEFVQRYGPVVHGWCRHWGLQEADAADVTQNVLLELARQMRSFEYDPAKRFRSWLRTVAHRAWCDFLDGRRRSQVGTGDTGVVELLASVPAADGLLNELEAAYEQEVLNRAMQFVRPRVESQTWEAFRLTVLEGLPAPAASKQLSLPIGSVYQAKSRVQRMLRVVIQELERFPDP